MDNNQQKQPNSAFVARRKVSVLGVHDRNSLKVICEQLSDMSGIQSIEQELDNNRIVVVYDTAKIGFNVIEKAFSDAGYSLLNNRWERFKYAWYRYLDENAKANAESKDGACCSNPSYIYAKRHK